MISALSNLLLAAASAMDVTGVWQLNACGRSVIELKIKDTSAGLNADLRYTEHLVINGDVVSNAKGVAAQVVVKADRAGPGRVKLSLVGADAAPFDSVINVELLKSGYLEIIMHPTQQSYVLSRSVAAYSPPSFLNLSPGAVCIIERPSNSEIPVMFQEDQASRGGTSINWKAVESADRVRRKRVEELLKNDMLQSGEDFYYAAVVFQHGTETNDYLQAHLLSTVALAKGKADAVWIASATLDRYLLAIGKPQVLGTQFQSINGRLVARVPYDRDLLNDRIRKALHVPTLSQQTPSVPH